MIQRTVGWDDPLDDVELVCYSKLRSGDFPVLAAAKHSLFVEKIRTIPPESD